MTIKILLVDDDLDILEQTKLMLESKGYKVVTANSSDEGWKKYQQEKPDIAVLDLIMEEYDSGFILAYKIKKASAEKKIPIIILTSVTYVTGLKFDAATVEEKEWTKCDAILNKPVVIDELTKIIETLISIKQSNKQVNK
ncbi:MAG: response regulator [Ignavibacteriaceae bacterium]|nr:response regulator [Ignavibacteriaceae bacterium]